jgi:hypothetical protein
MRAENSPARDLEALKRAAEVAIVFPVGYNLGHVALGKGSLWGLGELNLERLNPSGVHYRQVMANGFAEIERCLRLGVSFDLLGDFPGLHPAGYRELIRIREDGKVEVNTATGRVLLDSARTPTRSTGPAPTLSVTTSIAAGTVPLALTAVAKVTETAAPVFYTLGTDRNGVYQNAAVAWELYGPGEEDYQFLTPPGLRPDVTRAGNAIEARLRINLKKPGNYRLRTATVDLAGRSAVVWTDLQVSK